MDYSTSNELLQPQGPSPPDDPLPTTRKRKLYRSCDYCRKRRRACDATKLGIGPFEQSTSDSADPLAACTNCLKAHRVCTFEWLRSLRPENVPKGVQATLSTTGFWSQPDEGNELPERFDEAVLPDTRVMLGGSSLAGIPQNAASGDDMTFAGFIGQPDMITPSESDPTPGLSRRSSEIYDMGLQTDAAGTKFQRSYSGGTQDSQTATERLMSNNILQAPSMGNPTTSWHASSSNITSSWRRPSDQTGMFPSQEALRSPPVLRNPPMEQMSPIQDVPIPVIAQASSATTFSHPATSYSPSPHFFAAQDVPTAAGLGADDLSSIERYNAQSTPTPAERRLFGQGPGLRQRTSGGTCKECRSRGLLCDGKRPTCSPCTQSMTVCAYFTEPLNESPGIAFAGELARLRKSLKEHQDILDHLQSVPEAEALTMIRRLRLTQDLSSVVASVKSDATSMTQLSQMQMARATVHPTESKLEFELNVLHPSVYPALKPLNTTSVGLDQSFNGPYRSSFGVATNQDTSFFQSSLAFPTTIPQPAPPSGFDATGRIAIAGSMPAQQLCDSRLARLKINYWTKSPISDEFAARVLSNFLVCDYPVHACFDVDLFLSDLIELNDEFCSPLLVSAIMSIACVSYNVIDLGAAAYGAGFMQDAERLLQEEEDDNSTLKLASRCYLAMAALVNGDESLARRLTLEAHDMAISMNLFDVPQTDVLVASFASLSFEKMRELSYAAWGTYSWLSFWNAFFPYKFIALPPILPAPGDTNRGSGSLVLDWPPHSVPEYVDGIFTTLCELWVMVQTIDVVYYLKSPPHAVNRVSLASAESKYRKLLAWADTIPQQLLRGEHMSSHALLFHALYHCTVLALFRPFLDSPQQFSALQGSPRTAFFASLRQLKRVSFNYCARPSEALSLGWFNAPVMQLSYAVIMYRAADVHWWFYYLVCFRYWKDMTKRYRIFYCIAETSLDFAVRSNAINKATANQMMEELRAAAVHHPAPGEASSSRVLDFGRAVSRLKSAKLEQEDLPEEHMDTSQMEDVQDEDNQ